VPVGRLHVGQVAGLQGADMAGHRLLVQRRRRAGQHRQGHPGGQRRAGAEGQRRATRQPQGRPRRRLQAGGQRRAQAFGSRLPECLAAQAGGQGAQIGLRRAAAGAALQMRLQRRRPGRVQLAVQFGLDQQRLVGAG